ncbi:MAG: GNAT family N-acetyltransferase [Bacteroidetes bacterium]|nr:GNAT family N-acetyltransferase [Bacteroidota bacterium]
MPRINRTTPDDKDFISLATALGEELKRRDGEDHLFYAWLNSAPDLQGALVLYHHDTPAGCRAFRLFGPGCMELKRMFVPESFRRNGFASIILHELEQWCRELHGTTCVLETGLNQPEAIAFYEKHGYIQVPKFGKYMDSANSVCFRKDIQASPFSSRELTYI